MEEKTNAAVRSVRKNSETLMDRSKEITIFRVVNREREILDVLLTISKKADVDKGVRGQRATDSE